MALDLQPGGRTDVVKATLRAGASFLSVIREICASNVFLVYLLGASAGYWVCGYPCPLQVLQEMYWIIPLIISMYWIIALRMIDKI